MGAFCRSGNGVNPSVDYDTPDGMIIQPNHTYPLQNRHHTLISHAFTFFSVTFKNAYIIPEAHQVARALYLIGEFFYMFGLDIFIPGTDFPYISTDSSPAQTNHLLSFMLR